MGNYLDVCCCGTRKKEEELVKKRSSYDEGERKSTDDIWSFLQGGAIENDVTKFDKAHAAKDIKGLVELLDSNEKFDNKGINIHPWALVPETIGALAAFSLGQIASKDEGNVAGKKDSIRRAGGIPKLVKMLESINEDKKQAALIAISFLADENEFNAVEIYKEDAFGVLIRLLDDDSEGVQSAAALTLRNIYILSNRYKEDFIKLGGIRPLVGMLRLPAYETDQYLNQLEALFHITDFIFDGDDLIEKYVELFNDVNVTKYIQILIDLNNPNISEDAADTLQYFKKDIAPNSLETFL